MEAASDQTMKELTMDTQIDRTLESWLTFEPEAVLPVQFATRNWPDTPEHRLVAALLADPVSPHRPAAPRAPRRERGLFLEAATWIASDDVSWPYSFRNVCDLLGIDASALRSLLTRWYQQQQEQRIDGRRVVRMRRPPCRSRHSIGGR